MFTREAEFLFGGGEDNRTKRVTANGCTGLWNKQALFPGKQFKKKKKKKLPQLGNGKAVRALRHLKL